MKIDFVLDEENGLDVSYVVGDIMISDKNNNIIKEDSTYIDS